MAWLCRYLTKLMGVYTGYLDGFVTMGGCINGVCVGLDFLLCSLRLVATRYDTTLFYHVFFKSSARLHVTLYAGGIAGCDFTRTSLIDLIPGRWRFLVVHIDGASVTYRFGLTKLYHQFFFCTFSRLAFFLLPTEDQVLCTIFYLYLDRMWAD